MTHCDFCERCGDVLLTLDELTERLCIYCAFDRDYADYQADRAQWAREAGRTPSLGQAPLEREGA